MKAVANRTSGPIDREDALRDITLETPTALGRDLLVQIMAVSGNPVDAKQRLGTAPEGGDWRVLGYDAAGVGSITIQLLRALTDLKVIATALGPIT